MPDTPIFLSIIVPVYNVEQLLPRCLDSLLRQGLKAGEYEVICVNDGSSDHSAQILSDYEQKHPDIFRIITQENSGQGNARNNGLATARGKYIAFVDSDDWVIEGAYEYIREHYLQKEPDIMTFLATDVMERAPYHEAMSMHQDSTIIYEGTQLNAYCQHVYSPLWNKIYKREFLLTHHLVFEPIYFEDKLFNFQIFLKKPFVVLTDYNVYRYYQHANSIMHARDKQHLLRYMQDNLLILDKVEKSLEITDEEYAQWHLSLIERTINYFLNWAYASHLSYTEWRQNMRQLRKLSIHLLPHKKNSSMLDKIIVIARNLSTYSYIAYYMMSRRER